MTQETYSREEVQKLIDITFEISSMMQMYPNGFKDREQTMKWVALQLQLCGFPTYPCGLSWGVLKK